MPRFLVTVQIIEERSHVYEAADAQEAQNLAYDECAPEIAPGQYVHFALVEELYVHHTPIGWREIEGGPTG